MGDFRLGHNVVVAENAQIGPLSRVASEEELQSALAAAVEERLGSYDGERLYHLGIGINAYVLALPGVPLVLKPKSVLVISVTLWDNATQSKLNDTPRQFTVFEGLSAETLVGSGLTQNKQTQLERLSRNAARKIQDWILEHPEWIGLAPEPEDADATGES